MTIASTDIAIVGGGMVGLSLALLLARKNVVATQRWQPGLNTSEPWQITVLDRFVGSTPTTPASTDVDAAAYRSSFDARSTALAHSSEEILRLAGVWPLLSQHLTTIEQVHVSDRGHFGGAQLHAGDHQLAALGYVVENAWLGKVLQQAAQQEQSVQLQAPVHVLGMSASDGGYVLELDRAGEQQLLKAKLVVLAEGADSALRAKLGIEVDSEDYAQLAVVANIESDQAHRGVAYERFTDQGPMALLPLGESPQSRVSALVWTLPIDQHENISTMNDQEFLQRLQDRFGFRQGRFVKVSRRHVYPLHLQLAREQVRRSLVVMGNAAHFLHPVAGQGFNLALRDCAALTLALMKAEISGKELGDPQVLQHYVQQQSWDQWAAVRLSDGLVRLFSNQQWALSILRNVGILALDAFPPASHLFARQAMGYAL